MIETLVWEKYAKFYLLIGNKIDKITECYKI